MNKTIHQTNFPTLLLFISLNAWTNNQGILPLTESYFKLDRVYFQHDLWIFVHASVIIDQDQGASLGQDNRSLCRVGGSLVHRASCILHKHGGRVCTCLDSYQYSDRVQRKSFLQLKLTFTSPNIISTSPKNILMSRLISRLFCNLNPQETSLARRVS